ncbi:MAG: M20/M25/M40 family metallo-hydrolase, partial [Tepidiformaceae bacterium]
RIHMLDRMEEVLLGITAAFGASYTLEHQTSCPPLVNDAQVAEFVIGAASEFFGPSNIYSLASMGAEDMAVFLQRRPGCYFWLGARNADEALTGRHHDPGFMIDEDALPLGVEFGLRLIEGSLA